MALKKFHAMLGESEAPILEQEEASSVLKKNVKEIFVLNIVRSCIHAILTSCHEYGFVNDFIAAIIKQFDFHLV